MNVFLTGGTGFIGQAVMRAMRSRGWRVTALVRQPEGPAARWLARQGAALVAGDVTTDGPWMHTLGGFDLVVHNAGVYEIGADAATARRMAEVNPGGTERVLGAAHVAKAPKVLYVSTVWALGASGYAGTPSVPRDETHRHDGHHPTPYARSKWQAHEVALRWRAQGLPLVTALPNAVAGANDHAIFGYLLRLQLLGGMPPMGFGGDAVLAWVDVDALAEGLCRAGERAEPGADYLFCGEPMPTRALFSLWTRLVGRHGIALDLPRAVMRPQMALAEPLLRALGLPAFLSREAVDTTRCHIDYHSARAHRELGWSHPAPDTMWPAIIAAERRLMAARSGLLNKLRHQPVVAD